MKNLEKIRKNQCLVNIAVKAYAAAEIAPTPARCRFLFEYAKKVHNKYLPEINNFYASK